ncbi:MAG: aspartate aminotransferase family protein [Akkermansiaceae bacterium]|nr:aspartate aminotransferase family protein [Akkermansiaceae bacterium]
MLPLLRTAIPGPQSLALAAELNRYECRNVTYTTDDWPVFWQRADRANVWDVDGNCFLDLTSAFGVAGLGHGWSAEAMRKQSAELVHGMGDVHPTALKVEVCKQLSAMTFERWGEGVGKTTLSNSGFEAVETAMKTALLATGKSGILSFENAYHGLGYGALLGGGFDKFREPFEDQMAPVRNTLDFPTRDEDLKRLAGQLQAFDAGNIGAILVEPIQGRGGEVVPPDGFLTMLKHWCAKNGALLIFDEIFTGLNRTGKLFACDWEGVVPDIICIGKAMSGGYPISACVGKSQVMDAWPESGGEALHTSTFLGNPVGCAMALASLKKHAEPRVLNNVTGLGTLLKELLRGLKSRYVYDVRGRGLMLGVELRHPDGSPAGDIAAQVISDLLKRGVILLAGGPHGNVLGLTPPFVMTDAEATFVVLQLQRALDR